jgi:ferredoxin
MNTVRFIVRSGHPHGSVYPGPIGAILTLQLMQLRHAQSLPYALSLCGACYDVCPAKINIPETLIRLRAEIVDQERRTPARFFDPLYLALRITGSIGGSRQIHRRLSCVPAWDADCGKAPPFRLTSRDTKSSGCRKLTTILSHP